MICCIRDRMHQDQQSRVLCELSSLVLSIIRSPPPRATEDDSARRFAPGQISATGVAWLLLGMSLSLMVCGSVTFFIGILLMPWVLLLVALFYVAGFLSALSIFARAILYHATAITTPNKELSGWKSP